MKFRPIHPKDQSALASGIQTVFAAFNCDGPGYGPHDPDMADLEEFYTRDGNFYLVAENLASGQIVGGCGFAAYGPAEVTTCELRKLFLLPEARGTGTGKQLLTQTLEKAQQMGYQRCYLETVERMQVACKLYQDFGFEQLEGPLIEGGHHKCDRYYSRLLNTLGAWLGFLLLLLPACSSNTIPAPSEPVRNPELRIELMKMQRINDELQTVLIDKGITQLSFKDIYRQEALDRMHTSRLKEILARFGWPGIGLVGHDGADAAFHLAEHSHRDLQFQIECLELLEVSWHAKQAEGRHYAELYDGVQVAKGELQRYGTQAVPMNGRLVLRPVETPDSLDARRAKMGLIPLREYLNQLENAYKIRPK